MDAQDAEWVLGRAAAENMVQTSWDDFKDKAPTSIKPEYTSRSVCLRILDFNKSDTLHFADERCVELLVRGVTSHDPYLPNPEVDRDLFDHFASVYLRASDSFLCTNGYRNSPFVLSLPGKFIDAFRNWATTPDEAGFVFYEDTDQEHQGGWSNADLESGCFSGQDSEDSEDSDDEDLQGGQACEYGNTPQHWRGIPTEAKYFKM